MCNRAFCIRTLNSALHPGVAGSTAWQRAARAGRCESAGKTFIPVRSILCLQLIIASHFDRAVIHQVCGMSASCLCIALLGCGGCWVGAVLAVDARSEHSELTFSLAGRSSNLLSKYIESLHLLQ